MHTSDKPRLAAIYARRSTDDPKQVSIGRQKELCLTAAIQHGYETPQIFIDEGISGSVLERPGLEAMLAQVRSGAVSAVFVADGDRLSREPAHDWLIRQELKRYQAELYINGTIPDDSIEGELQQSVLAVFAKFERRKTVQRMIAGKNYRVRSGRPTGGYTALGYRYVPGPEAHYELIPEEAELVRRIYQMYLAGNGVLRIALQLTQERIPTKVDRLPSRKGKKQRPTGVWSKSSIQHILRNQLYATGVLYWNRDEAVEPRPENRRKPRNPKSPKTAKRRRDISEWIPVKLPPIIDQATFDQAQAQIAKNAQANQRNRKHEYLFLQGRLRCGHCGFAMSGQLAGGRAARTARRRYVCTGRTQRLEAPCRKSVSAELLEQKVWELLWHGILVDPKNLQSYIRQKEQDAERLISDPTLTPARYMQWLIRDKIIAYRISA